MTPRCAAQARTLLVVSLGLSLSSVAARADDLWFQPATQPVSDNSSASGPPEAGPPEITRAPGAAIVLGVPLAAPATPSPSRQAASPADAQPPPLPVRLPRFTVDVGAGVTMANTDNPPVNLSVNMWGRDPSNPLPVVLTGQLPYGTQVDVRAPERQLGLHVSYILSPNPTIGAPQVSIGASFGVNTYNQAETAREGVATLRIDF
jgi:hypothetical protein